MGYRTSWLGSRPQRKHEPIKFLWPNSLTDFPIKTKVTPPSGSVCHFSPLLYRRFFLLTPTATMKLLFCLRFPSLRRKKNPKRASHPTPRFQNTRSQFPQWTRKPSSISHQRNQSPQSTRNPRSRFQMQLPTST
ncbi:hypothetical protein K440DRAFT_166383 [Wilcoxina mikolae CBS 423.85]|nr:hypothetical protein K440DRAFT_166383 [Wilcoxina mikolae CBS 423.85]